MTKVDTVEMPSKEEMERRLIMLSKIQAYSDLNNALESLTRANKYLQFVPIDPLIGGNLNAFLKVRDNVSEAIEEVEDLIKLVE